MDRKSLKVIKMSQILCLIGGVLLLLSGSLFLLSNFSKFNLIPLFYFSDNWGIFTFFCLITGIMVIISAAMMPGHRKTGQYTNLVLGIGCIIGLFFYPQIDYFSRGLNVVTVLAVPIASILTISGGLISTLSRFTLKVDFIKRDSNFMIFLLIVSLPLYAILLPFYHISSFHPIRAYDNGGSFRFSSNGKYIIAANQQNLTVFETSSSTPLWNIPFPGITDMSITGDGRYFVVSSTLNGLALFDISNSTPVWRYYTPIFSSADISELGNVIAAKSQKSVLTFNFLSPIPINNYTIPYSVEFVEVSTSNIAIASRNYLFFYNLLSTTPLWNFSYTREIYSLSLSSGGGYIVLGCRGKAFFFDTSSSSPVWNYTINDDIHRATISSDGSYIIARSQETLLLFHKNSSIPIWTTEIGGSTMDISYNGSYIVANDGENGLNYFSRISSTPLWIYRSAINIGDLAISSDGSSIIAKGTWGIYLFNSENVFIPETLLRISGLIVITVITSLIYTVWKIRFFPSDIACRLQYVLDYFKNLKL